MDKKITIILVLTLAATSLAQVPTYRLDCILPAPHCTSVDLSPDGTKLCARMRYGDWNEGYRVFDAETYSILNDCGGHYAPWTGLVSADNTYLWTTEYYGGYVKKIALIDCSIAKVIDLGDWTGGLAFDSNRRYLYVGENDPGTWVIGSLKVIDTATETVVWSLTLNGEPSDRIVVDPSDEFIYLFSRNPGSETLYKIRTAPTFGVAGTLSIYGIGASSGFSISPDGGVLYLPYPQANLVKVLNTGALTISQTWTIPSPEGFFVSPDGTHAVVTSSDNSDPSLRIFDPLSGQIIQTISVGDIGTYNAACEDRALYWDMNRGKVYVNLCSTEGGVAVLVPEVILVNIDIKPGSYPNAINLGSQGLVPVAILSSEDFDANSVDPDTVELAGADVEVRGKSNRFMAHQEDVDGDGLFDLVVQVATANLDPNSLQNGYAVLTGKTFGGQDIEGQDEITIVPPEK